VSADTVTVSWTSDDTIVVHCAGKNFIHLILSNSDDNVLSSSARMKTQSLSA